MKTCNACKRPYRGAGSRVYVPRDGGLTRTNVCPSCAGAAVAVLVSTPTTDARRCLVCHEERADLGERCAMKMRTHAARQGAANLLGLATGLGYHEACAVSRYSERCADCRVLTERIARVAVGTDAAANVCACGALMLGSTELRTVDGHARDGCAPGPLSGGRS